jgi:hypothetical protein
MVMGPCGGVRADGRCEVVPQPCAFEVPAVWDDPVPPVPLPVAAVPLILADFSSEPYSLPMLRSVAAALAPSCDAVLVGEHQNRPDFPPAPDWQDRVAAVERELQRRFGSTPQLAAATEQSDRIAAMLGAGQLTSQVLTLRRSG